MQTPKTPLCQYFHDDQGSELFGQICDLPEYYPTRTEQAILESSAAEETIRTEIFRKFHFPSLIGTLDHQSLHPLQVWTDERGWFGLLLCQRQCAEGDYP
jgi:uncharacterized SAM-dependent methyltransferase